MGKRGWPASIVLAVITLGVAGPAEGQEEPPTETGQPPPAELGQPPPGRSSPGAAEVEVGEFLVTKRGAGSALALVGSDGVSTPLAGGMGFVDIRGIAACPDGSVLVADAGADAIYRFGADGYTEYGGVPEPEDVACGDDEILFTSAGSDTVSGVTRSGELLAVLAFTGQIHSLVDLDNGNLAVVLKNGTVIVWDRRTGELTTTPITILDPGYAAAVALGFCVGGGSGGISCFDNDGEPTTAYQASAAVTALSSNGRFLFASRTDGMSEVFDQASTQSVRVFECPGAGDVHATIDSSPIPESLINPAVGTTVRASTTTTTTTTTQATTTTSTATTTQATTSTTAAPPTTEGPSAAPDTTAATTPDVAVAAPAASSGAIPIGSVVAFIGIGAGLIGGVVVLRGRKKLVPVPAEGPDVDVEDWPGAPDLKGWTGTDAGLDPAPASSPPDDEGGDAWQHYDDGWKPGEPGQRGQYFYRAAQGILDVHLADGTSAGAGPPVLRTTSPPRVLSEPPPADAELRATPLVPTPSDHFAIDQFLLALQMRDRPFTQSFRDQTREALRHFLDLLTEDGPVPPGEDTHGTPSDPPPSRGAEPTALLTPPEGLTLDQLAYLLDRLQEAIDLVRGAPFPDDYRLPEPEASGDEHHDPAELRSRYRRLIGQAIDVM